MIRFNRQGSALRFAAVGVRPRPVVPLGDIVHPVTLTVRQLQQALVRAGYDIGRFGVDGRWGRDTMMALKRFVYREFGMGQAWTGYEVDTNQQVLIITQDIWNRLRTVDEGSGGETQTRRSRSSTTTRTSSPSRGSSTSSVSSSDIEAIDAELGEEESNLWTNPWLWGGVALVTAAGLAFVLTRETEDDPLEDEELLPAL